MNSMTSRISGMRFILGLLAVGWLWTGPCLAEDVILPADGADVADFDPLAGLGSESASEIEIAAVIEPGAAGKPDMLAVTATLEEGWHLYSITQKPGGPLATKLAVAADSLRKTTGLFVSDPPPHVRKVDDIPAWKGLSIEEHGDTVTWRAPLAAGAGDVKGSVRFQLCQDTSCLPPRTISFVAKAAGSGPKTVPRPAATVMKHTPERSHVTLEAEFGPAKQIDGASGIPVLVKLVPAEGWHLYQPSGNAKTEVGQGKPTIVAAAGDDGRLLAVSAAQATAAEDPNLAETGAVEGPVVLELVLSEGDEPADILIGFQTCSDETCDPPTAVRLVIELPAGDSASHIEFSAAKYGEVAKAPASLEQAAVMPAVDREIDVTPAGPTVAGPRSASSSKDAPLSLPLAILMGLAGGLILNLMPCVLPVLGLKLMSFAQQSGRARQEVFQMNLWYCAGLFAVFFVLATAAVAANIGLANTNLGWGQQFGSIPFKIGMLGVVFAFALSFLGVWELPIPGFIGEKAGHVQSQEGPLGAFLKGVLSTVLATPCSGPFLGTVFGYTLTQPTAVTYVIFGAIALGMSSPYILIGLFPALVRFLPKPGAWMETFKEILGFVMLGTVAYLFYLLRQQPDWFVPTFVMLVAIWMGCWWVGRAQERTGIASFGQWVQAGVGAAVVSTVAFFWLGPHDAFIQWEKPFSVARLAELRREGTTVMVDFSADWCPTCKTNLFFAIETTPVKAAIEKNRVVPMLADWTDGSEEIREVLEGLGSRSIPLLAIYPGAKPGEQLRDPIVLRDVVTQREVMAALNEAGPSCCPPPEMRAASVTLPARAPLPKL
jgi:thiol:disulfide interchange protein